MLTLDVEQGSDEWLAARAGLLTASNFGKVITSTGKKSTQARAYMFGLIAEKMTGKKADTFSSKSMDRGVEMEVEARNYYEFVTDNYTKEIGLVYLNEYKKVSCSPDALVNDDRGLEIKCPLASTQIEYLLAGKLPAKYVPQVQGSMFVTGLKKWDFLSYHPDLDPLLITVEADPEYLKILGGFIDGFISEMDQKLKVLGYE